MKRHGSALALVFVAVLVAALMAVFARRPVPVSVHAPVKVAQRGGIAMVDGAALVDLNEADEALLMELPGVGAALARAIVDGRPYGEVEELLHVKGIGEAKMAGLRGKVAVCATP